MRTYPVVSAVEGDSFPAQPQTAYSQTQRPFDSAFSVTLLCFILSGLASSLSSAYEHRPQWPRTNHNWDDKKNPEVAGQVTVGLFNIPPLCSWLRFLANSKQHVTPTKYMVALTHSRFPENNVWNIYHSNTEELLYST